MSAESQCVQRRERALGTWGQGRAGRERQPHHRQRSFVYSASDLTVRSRVVSSHRPTSRVSGRIGHSGTWDETMRQSHSVTDGRLCLRLRSRVCTVGADRAPRRRRRSRRVAMKRGIPARGCARAPCTSGPMGADTREASRARAQCTNPSRAVAHLA
jgi:hypothetical protein